METLPQTQSAGSEARAVSDILAKANPAEIPAMRTSLSFLTSAGAELATALQARTREVEELRSIMAALPPEWIEAAKSGQPLPDLGALRAELRLAQEERDGFLSQLTDRNAQVDELTKQLALVREEFEQRAVASVAITTEELDQLRAREAELQAALDARSAEVEGLQGQLAELQSSVESRTAEVSDLQQKLAAMQEDLESRNAEIEELQARINVLQTDLDLAAADKAVLSERLAARDAEMGEILGQATALQRDLEALVPAQPEPAAAMPAEGEAPPTEEGEAPPAEEGEQAPPVQRPTGMAALAASIAAAIAAYRKKDVELADTAAKLTALSAQADGLIQEKGSLEQQLTDLQAQMAETVAIDTAALNEQIQSLSADKMALEADLQDKDMANAALNSQVENLNVQLAELQGELDSVLGAKAEVEALLQAREAELADLNSEIVDLQGQLEAMLPAELRAAVPVAEGGEGEVAPAAEGEEGEAESALGRKAVRLGALATGIAALADRSRQQSDTLEALQSQLNSLAAEKDQLTATLQEQERTLADYNERFLALQGEINTLTSDKASLEMVLEEKNQTIANLQSQLDAVTAEKAALEQALADTQAQLAAAQNELASIEEESQRVLGERGVGVVAIGAGAATAAALRRKDEDLEEAQAKIAELQAAIEAKEQELAQINSANAALEDQINGLAAEKTSLELSLQEKEQGLADVQAQSAALQARIDELDAQVGSLQEQLAAMESQRQAVEAALLARESELADLQGRLNLMEPLRSTITMADRLSQLPRYKTGAAGAAFVSGAKPVLVPNVQALTDVTGIGSVFQQRLYNAGIGTYWELANLSNEDLQQILEISDTAIVRLDADAIRASAAEWARETGTVGQLWDGDHVDDFEPIPGIGKTFEKRLYEAGICTYEQLIDTDSERLAEIIAAPAAQRPDFAEWKAVAQSLIAARQQAAGEAEG